MVVVVLGLVLGVLGVLVPIAIALLQAHNKRVRRAQRLEKKQKAELKAAKKRLAEIEATIQRQNEPNH